MHPHTIHTEVELEEILSRPSAQDEATLRELGGDLLVLGVSGKMGPTLARRAARALAGTSRRVIGVARFSEAGAERRLRESGVETVAADIVDEASVAKLPDAENVIFMAGRKFGSTGAEHLTWAINTYLPAQVARRYRDSRIVVFSSGNVYPLMPVVSGGAREDVAPAAVGEYAQSVLGRERIFEYFSSRFHTRVCLVRLNYAIDMRYGVLLDIGSKVFAGEAVDVTMGAVNVIWQGDANSVCLRSLSICQSPPKILNLTGPETLSVRGVAHRFGELFKKLPVIVGQESDTALLNHAGQCQKLFGNPSVGVDQMIEWIAQWISAGGSRHGKPTHFQTRDGKF